MNGRRRLSFSLSIHARVTSSSMSSARKTLCFVPQFKRIFESEKKDEKVVVGVRRLSHPHRRHRGRKSHEKEAKSEKGQERGRGATRERKSTLQQLLSG